MNQIRSESGVTKPRVVVVSDAVPQRNGVGAYYHDLSRHLQPHVEFIETLSPRLHNGLWEGGWTLPMPGDYTQRFAIPSFPRLHRTLKSFRPDVVIVPTPGLYGLAGARYGKRLGARVLVGFHTWYEKLSELYWNRLQGGFSKGYLHLSNRLLFRYADCVLANSESMCETAQRIGARQVELMGTPVAHDFIHTPVSLPGSSVKNVLFAGRLAAEKNIEAVLTATEALPEIQFSIAGDGPERYRLEAAAGQQDNLQYLGWLDRDELMAAIDRHDTVILPSHIESFGTIALEAMARQRYTVVSPHCGITQWPELRHGLFCLDAGESLTSGLVRLKQKSEYQRRQMAGYARQAAVDINDWNTRLWRHYMQVDTRRVVA